MHFGAGGYSMRPSNIQHQIGNLPEWLFAIRNGIRSDDTILVDHGRWASIHSFLHFALHIHYVSLLSLFLSGSPDISALRWCGWFAVVLRYGR